MNHRSRGALIALGLSALAVTGAPSIASAASVGESYTHSLTSGSESLGGFHLGGYDALGLARFDVASRPRRPGPPACRRSSAGTPRRSAKAPTSRSPAR